MHALRRLIRAETALFLREPFAVFFTLVFPVLLLLIFGHTFAGNGQDYPGLPGYAGIEVFVPQLVAQVACYLGFMGIPIAFAEYRDMGVLRRLQATPLRLSQVLGAHLAVQFAMLLVAIVLLVVATALSFDLIFGGNALLAAGMLVLAALCSFSIGLALAGILKTARLAQAFGAGAFFPMLFLSGVALPRTDLPAALQNVGDVLPMTRVVDLMVYAWIGKPFDAYQWASIVIVALYTAAAIFVIRRAFRW